MRQKDRPRTWKQKEDQKRTWISITGCNKCFSPRLMGTPETPLKTLGLKPLTMIQVLAVVVLVVDCLTKACSFRSCSSSDLQESRQHR